jgi:hypothetical protein
MSALRIRLDKAAKLALGDGVPKDEAAAARIYKLEADRGSGEAAFNLGTMYANGEGVPKSWRNATRMFRESERLGFGPASTLLGELELGKTHRNLLTAELALVHFALASVRRDVRGIDRIAELIESFPRLSARRIGKCLRIAYSALRDEQILLALQKGAMRAPRSKQLVRRQSKNE